ncbi:pyrimidine dimer DNA glycosylase/endonuclease V [Corynebacterium uterequi]|uniref:DNA lyase n=1 Tax=Corynebacterium uterequi TaxID=1072256 RepID=A0A0G3HER0_9CORY|nr:pyrimidine dimer DNA glycosylase/endonuclease V [Corynebacterium uterequi]AKK11794.1 hypothetical protein CUTER_09085 [Corynebacterium uterequi]
MRLWSLSPAVLDRVGLVACWREGLLAQKVLLGATKGYRNHPQLHRFRELVDPLTGIGAFLSVVQDDATRRGYSFDRSKIHRPLLEGGVVPVLMTLTRGQLEYELDHLRAKVRERAPEWEAELALEPHPIFELIDGPIEDWERVR